MTKRVPSQVQVAEKWNVCEEFTGSNFVTMCAAEKFKKL